MLWNTNFAMSRAGRLLLVLTMSSLPLLPMVPQEPVEAPPDDPLVELEARLAETNELLAELDLDLAANREERRGLRPAHTRARKLDSEYSSLLRRHELLSVERAAMRTELLARHRMAQDAEQAGGVEGPAVPAASREARMEALLLGADALGDGGLAGPASVLLEMFMELEGEAPVGETDTGAAIGASEDAPPSTDGVPIEGAVPADPTAERIERLEQRVDELAGSIAELVELMKGR